MAPLASFPIVSTRDTDEAQSVLSRELTRLQFKSVQDRRSFRLEMNGVHLGRTMIGYNRFHADTVVDAGEMGNAVALAVGSGGPPSTIELDGEPVVCVDSGAIVSPSRRVVNLRPAGGGVLVARAEMGAIEERFREVLDRRPVKPIVFDRSVDLTSGVGAHTRRALDFLVAGIESNGAVLENSLLRASLDDMLLSVLVALPNNYSDALVKGDRQVSGAPRIVRRAEEFLEAHADEPITISNVVAECGISRNTLFTAFRKYRGYSPMQFLADCRLDSARHALRSPSPTDTVSSIASEFGFAHLGRFSAQYKRTYGESPSTTLRRGSRRRSVV
jgi:AraC-like DNA-binding protein